jgi:hypothetical protein
MANKSPEQIAAKYQRGVAGASQDYAEGVQNPSRPWAAATAAAAGRWRAGIQEAINNNSFQRGVQKVGDAKWQERAVNRGAANYASAAPSAAQEYARVAGQIMAAGNAAKQAALAMPGDTQEQRIQRATAAMRAVSSYWKNR